MTKPTTTAEQYCAQFVCGNDESIRPWLRYLYVNDGMMIGTNGHMGCIVKTKFDDGYYDATTFEQNVNVTDPYPDVARNIPSDMQLQNEVRFRLSELEIETSTYEQGDESVTIEKVNLGGQIFNLEFLRVVSNGADEIGARIAHSWHVPSLFYLYDQPFEPYTVLVMSMGQVE